MTSVELCDCSFCLYFCAGRCGLGSVTLGASGQCEDLLYVSIDDEIIKDAKKAQLKRYEGSDKPS